MVSFYQIFVIIEEPLITAKQFSNQNEEELKEKSTSKTKNLKKHKINRPNSSLKIDSKESKTRKGKDFKAPTQKYCSFSFYRSKIAQDLKRIKQIKSPILASKKNSKPKTAHEIAKQERQKSSSFKRPSTSLYQAPKKKDKEKE